MNSGRTVFAQIIEYFSHNEFHRCVERYDGDHRVRKLTCWEQFLAMAFAQLTYRESLRDIEVSLAAHRHKLKENLQFQRRRSGPVDKSVGLRSDQTIVLTGPLTSQRYPAPLRRISYYAQDIDKRFVFLTNDFFLPPLTVAETYRCRWQIELFFKWIKQHLRIKRFFGTSPNSVKVQVWIAVAVYLLIAILKKELRLEYSLHTILQILSTTDRKSVV